MIRSKSSMLIYALLVLTVNSVAVFSNWDCPPGKMTGDPLGRCCALPFMYKGKKYYSCTTSGGLGSTPWCSLDSYYAGDWAYCVDSYCPPGKKTTDQKGRCCVFPFIYAGKKFYSCTTALDRFQPWCSFDKYYVGKWAYCVDECASSPCKNGASCKTTDDSEVGYSCQPCPEGWQGKTCDKVDECAKSPCKNGASCKITEDGYSCQPCPAGWKGKDCDEGINECLTFPCKNGGTCVSQEGDTTCNCKPGFTGEHCEEDIDECKSNPCENEGTCVNEQGNYTCTCNTGFAGKLCDKDVDECQSDPCKNGGTCANEQGTFTCACNAAFTGKLCEKDIDECKSDPCKNRGMCVNKQGSYTCTCDAGFTGKLCENDIDECKSAPCKNGGTCANEQGNYTCTCNAGFAGKLCDKDIDECKSSPCKNWGRCVNEQGNYTCICNAGFTGKLCEKDIDECQSSPCKNGGRCVNEEGNYACTCNAGFTGKLCEKDIDECKSSPCKNGGRCVNQQGNYTCTCNAGYTGKLCEKDIDECKSSPCENGATCLNTQGNYTCTCNAGFTGFLCEKDIDECKSSPCKNGGRCVNEQGNYACTCNAGFTGKLCEKDIDECKSSPCENGGTCFNEQGNFTCTCNAGFTGKLCQKDIDECKSSPCENGATCFNEQGNFTCACNAGFTGKLCDKDIDECKSFPCKNNGTCVNRKGNFTCACMVGFIGELCEEECSVPMGMESGDIPDSALKASTAWNANYDASKARLNKPSTYVSRLLDKGQWVQVDLGKVSQVTKIGTQGRYKAGQWITKYTISYSIDGDFFQFQFDNSNTIPREYRANTDYNSVVLNSLDEPIIARHIRIHPVEWNGYIAFRFELYGCYSGFPTPKTPACMAGLGLENREIPDSAITASSYVNAYQPSNGRLQSQPGNGGNGYGYGWVPKTSNDQQWFQVDFSNWTKVSRVAIQGRGDAAQWLTKFKLAYSYYGVFFTDYSEDGRLKVFSGNTDQFTANSHLLNNPIITRFIRIIPLSWQVGIGLRADFYGCTSGFDIPKTNCNTPLGMQSGHIPDSALAASSRFNQFRGPERGRLFMQNKGSYAGGWSSQYLDDKQFIQIDLGVITKVTRIAHQGVAGINWWTKSFTLSYSDNGADFSSYKDQQVFEGNTDDGTPVGHILDIEIIARFIKFNVKEFQGYPSLRVELYGCTDGFPTPATPKCMEALGMQSGDIPDSAITSSSFGGSGLAPYVGRLHFLSSGSGKQGGWAAGTSDVNQWFQVDFGNWTKIIAVATQGRQDYDEWVESYNLAYSYDGVFYIAVEDEEGLEKTFQANSDRYTVVKNEVDQPITTKFIRILPQTWKSRISMRTEFYGCKQGIETPDVGCTSPLGMAKGTIPDAAIVASSRYNQYGGPDRARLNMQKQGNFYGGWTSQYTDAKQFLQIDLGQVTKVTRIAHQGRSDASWWTKTYTLSYSDDGGKFMPYNNSQVIEGNTDSKTAVGRILDPPIVARFLKINVQSFYGYPTLRIELYGCTEGFPTPATPPCMKALGMQSGDIPDSAVTASSFGGSGLAPYVGRLHFLSSGSGKQGSWAARTSDVNQWFQVNFGKWTKITAVASQGRQDSDEWVGSYTLAYSYEGVFYTPVNREDGLIKTFTANSDRYTVVKNELDQSIITKFIRILPKTWKSRISMRTEFYGCDEGFEIPDVGCTSPLGMEKGTIPDSAIVASSRYNQYAGPERARLNLPKQGSNYGGWSSQFGDNEQFLQIDLGQVTKVTRIAHQGRSDANWWTTSYTLSYSNDGVTFKPYNNSQTLQGNNDATTAVGRILDPPIVARFLKINVQSFNGYPALRVELYGCTDGFSTPTPSKCMDALGMQSGVIPNSAVTASSSFNANSPPYIGRLHFLSAGSGKYGSWISGRNNLDQWFQVDFGSWTKVRGVSTQGRQDAGQWVGKYSLSFSYDGIFYQTVNDETGLKKIFNANSDQYSVVRNTLDTPIITRYIRIQPETWNAYIAMRTEFYGCREGFDPPEIVCADALGMESGDIPDSALTSSSDYNQYFGAQRSRLKSERNGSYYGGWASKSLDYNQWLQIDLRNLTKVTRIATQGLHDASWWVTKYKLSYSSGDKFEFYNNGEEITGNMDRNTAEGRILDPPILARYFRINPTAWYGRLSMRVELFGCRGGTD